MVFCFNKKISLNIFLPSSFYWRFNTEITISQDLVLIEMDWSYWEKDTVIAKIKNFSPHNCLFGLI